MASVSQCLVHQFSFSDFSLGNDQKNMNKNFCVDAYTNIIEI